MTLAMVTAAQKSWGDGIVAISKSHTDGGDYEQTARDHINNLYGYAEGEVLFSQHWLPISSSEAPLMVLCHTLSPRTPRPLTLSSVRIQALPSRAGLLSASITQKSSSLAAP